MFLRKFLTVFMFLSLVVLVSGYPLTVVDDLGRVVTIQRAPERVVSVAPSATRFLISLGLKGKIVGVTDWDPLKAEGVESVGNMVPLNLEKIISLEPDLVLSFGGFQAGEVYKLEKMGITVIAINPTTLNDILKSLSLLGAVFGVENEAKALVKNLQKELMDVALKAYKVPVDKRPKVLYLSASPDANMKEFWVPVSGSYLNDLIILAGGRNITAGLSGPNGWAPVSIEYIVSQNPDVIIVATYIPGSEDSVKKAVMDYPPFKDLNAVKNGKIFIVDGNLASQPSPDIFKLLKAFYDFFYGR